MTSYVRTLSGVSGEDAVPVGGAWSYALGGTSASGLGTQRELTTARGRTCTWRLDATDTAQFTIDGAGSEAAGWPRLATDLYVRRDGELLHRGRVAPEQGSINASGHTVSLTSMGYRGWLDTLEVAYPPPIYTAVAQGAIAWDLINTAQSRTNGSLGITDGIGSAAGTVRTRTDYVPGKPIGEAVSELGRVDNGFEWEIGADLALNRWYPQRGADNGVVLDYPGRIVDVQYTFDPASFGNVATSTGDQTTTPVTTTSATIATDPRGRIERAVGYPSINDQTTLTAKSVFQLAQTNVIKVGYTVTLRPGTWGGKSDVWIGDTVHLAIKSGRVSEIMTAQRVIQITATPGDNGTETVQMVLAAP